MRSSQYRRGKRKYESAGSHKTHGNGDIIGEQDQVLGEALISSVVLKERELEIRRRKIMAMNESGKRSTRGLWTRRC